MPEPSRPARAAPVAASRQVRRWECHCQDPPVLLGTYDANGVNIKCRDRYWHATGHVRSICPKCGAPHTIDLTSGLVLDSPG